MNRLLWISACAVVFTLVPWWSAVSNEVKPEKAASEELQEKEEAAAKETAEEDDSSHYVHLKPLAWMVGTWVVSEAEGTVTTTCKWTKNRNFLTRTFQIVTPDDRELQGTQIIGWDPIRKEIRSWMFDSEGGFGQGTWTRDGDRWITKASQVLAGGKRAAAVNIMTRAGDDSFTWQSVSREVDGEMLPNGPEVTLVRKKAE